METEKNQAEVETEIIDGLKALREKELELNSKISEIKPIDIKLSDEDNGKIYTTSEFFKEFSDIFEILLPNLNTSGKAVEIKDGLKKIYSGGRYCDRVVVGRKLTHKDDYRERGTSLQQAELFALLREVELDKYIEGKDERVLRGKVGIIKKIREIIKNKDVGLKTETYNVGENEFKRYKIRDWEYASNSDEVKSVKVDIDKEFEVLEIERYGEKINNVEKAKAKTIELSARGYLEIKGEKENHNKDDYSYLVGFNLSDLNNGVESVKDVYHVKVLREFEKEIKEGIEKLREVEDVKQKNRKEIIAELKKEFGDKLTINAI